MYNYLEAIKEDVAIGIGDDWSISEEDFNDRQKLYNHLYDSMISDDNVTGSFSGSYTNSKEDAIANLNGNYKSLLEANNECTIDETLYDDPEYLDVCIRCYLLEKAINEVLDELEGCREVKAGSQNNNLQEVM